MDHAPLLRYVIPINESVESEVTRGVWLRKARVEGVESDDLRRVDPIRRKYEAHPASILWTYVEDFYETYRVCPSPAQILHDLESFRNEGKIDEVTARSIVSFLDEVQHLPAADHGFTWALESSRTITRRRALELTLLETGELINTDLNKAEDRLRAVGAAGKNASIQVHALSDGNAARWEAYVRAGVGGNTATPTGWKQFDNRTGGVWPGDFGMIAARTGKGKSVLMTGLAANQYRMDKSCLLVSGEMLVNDYRNRFEGLLLGVDPQKIRLGWLGSVALERRYLELLRTLSQPGQGRVDIVDRSNLSVTVLRDLLHRQQDTIGRNYDLILVDPIYRLKASTHVDQDWLQLTHVAEEVKALALEERVAIFGAGQIKRSDGRVVDETEMLSRADGVGFELDWLWTILQNPDKSWDVKMGKVRHGEDGWSFTLNVDMKRGLIEEPDGTPDLPPTRPRDASLPALPAFIEIEDDEEEC